LVTSRACCRIFIELPNARQDKTLRRVLWVAAKSCARFRESGGARLQRAGRCILRRRTLIEAYRFGTASAVKQLGQVREGRMPSPARRMRALPNSDTVVARESFILLQSAKSCINSNRFKIKACSQCLNSLNYAMRLKRQR
jgi:hypothetical protein